MPHLVRAGTVLLCAGLAGLYVVLGEIRFAVAAAAILCLVEIALALRARAVGRAVRVDPTNFEAGRISYSEQDGDLAVTLSGAGGKRSVAPCVVLSRVLRPPADTTAQGGGLRLEVSPPRCSFDWGIQDACLSPRLLRLALEARAAEALGAEAVCVRLPEGTDQRRLERALRQILRGVPFTSERSVPEAEEELSEGIAS